MGAPQDEYKLYRVAIMFLNLTKIKHFKWWPKYGFTNIKGTQILTKSCKSKKFKWWFEDGFTNIKGTHVFTESHKPKNLKWWHENRFTNIEDT
jgi:hypothetical protein